MDPPSITKLLYDLVVLDTAVFDDPHQSACWPISGAAKINSVSFNVLRIGLPVDCLIETLAPVPAGYDDGVVVQQLPDSL